MFESSLVESSALIHSSNRLPTLISLGIQAFLVAAFVAIPMLHPEVLSLAPSKLSTLTPPRPPAPKPPPERPRVVTTTPAVSMPSAPSQAANMIRSILTQNSPAIEEPTLAVTMNTIPAAPGLPIVLNATTPAAVVAAKSASPTRISQGVLAGMLLAPIQPTYPPIAKVTHTEGTVVVQALISKSGRIESARAISGPPMLQAAALDAVRAARYRPYLLNNEPTEVETTISIIFHLSS
jgi:protein TonB